MELERTISVKGQIVIPKDIRKKIGIKPGQEVVFEVEGNRIIIKKRMSAKEFVEDFMDVPRKIKGLSAKRIDTILEGEYEIP